MSTLPEGLIPLDAPDAVPQLPEGLTPLEEGEVASIESEEPSIGAQLAYGWDKDSRNIFQNAGRWLEARFPIGRLEIIPGKHPGAGIKYRSPKELYGEDWDYLTTEERRQRLDDLENQRLAQAHPDIHGTEYADSTASNIGEFAALVKDPSTYIPFGSAKAVGFGKSLLTKEAGKAIGVMAAEGAAINATSEMLYQATRESEMDYWEVGKAAMVGAVLTPVLTTAITKGFGALGAKFSKTLDDKADELVESVQTKINEKVAGGVNRVEAVKATLAEMSITSKDLNAAMARSNKGVFIPKTKEQAAELIVDPEPVGMRTWKEGSLLDDLIEPIATRVKKMSDKVWLRLQQLEMNIHEKPLRILSKADDLLFKHVDDLSDENRGLFTKAWMNQDWNTINRIFKDNPKAKEGLRYIREAYDELFPQLQKIYPEMKKTDNYLSRHVKDLEGLKAAMGSKLVKGFDEQVYKKEMSLGRKLTEIEKIDLVNTYLRGNQRSGYQLSSTKERMLDQVPQEWLQFYATPRETFHIYVRRAITDIEKNAFFHRHTKRVREFNSIDSEGSIGGFVADLGLTGDQMNELRKLLNARFVAGEQSSKKAISMFRNLGYLGTLGDHFSTATQLQDVAFSAVKHGLGATFKALRDDFKIRADLDFGISAATEELAESNLKSAKALEWVLKRTGFKLVDRFAKTLDLNASFSKWTKAVKSEAGVQELTKKYGNAFGDDFALLVHDLQKGQITPRTKLMLWCELARTQPTSKSETPLKHLENPNGRLFYQMMTFTIKNFNFVRDEIFREQFAKGNYAEGAKQLARYAAFMSISGVGVQTLKNWALGKEVTTEDVPDMAIVAFWKNFGGAEMVVRNILEAESVGQGARAVKQTLSGLLDMTVPIWDMAISAGDDMIKIFEDATEEETYKEKERRYSSLRYIPFAGKFLYNWFGGGLEKWNEDREQKEERYWKNYGT